MRITLLLTFLLSLRLLPVSAQSDPLTEKLRKGYELYQQDKLDEAATYTEKLLKKNPDSGDGWDLLVMIRKKQFEHSESVGQLGGQLFNNITVVTKDKNGKEVKSENDSLGRQLAEMLRNFNPSKAAYDRFINTARKATLVSNEAYQSSAFLRAFLVDTEVDTNVSEKAKHFFHQAEQQFEDKDYHSAALSYKKALEEQPDYYKASLYLGDTYYTTGDYPEAITSFKDAIRRFPTFLEPRKYLSDAYAKADLYEKAADEAIYALAVYPDLTMVAKLEIALSQQHRRLDIKWTRRPVFPNKIKADTGMLKMQASGAEEPETLQAPWTYYRKAQARVAPYCDKRGIISRTNPVTTTRYLEVYSWEEMLKASDDPALAEAKRMQQAGYLDCYVLVTCFHQDFYDQYLDFVTKNRDKVAGYYKKFIQ